MYTGDTPGNNKLHESSNHINMINHTRTPGIAAQLMSQWHKFFFIGNLVWLQLGSRQGGQQMQQ
jgi:hypothetical protein